MIIIKLNIKDLKFVNPQASIDLVNIVLFFFFFFFFWKKEILIINKYKLLYIFV